jgi:formylglycine-generating enzyme
MFRGFCFIISIFIIFGCTSKQTEAFSSWKEPITGMEFILIPKGSFSMGNSSNNHNGPNTELQHKVKISHDFWLARFEVTQEQWQHIMGKEEIHPEKPSPFRNTHPQYPVVGISYFDIQQFMDRLNTLSTDHQFRLPTEAEWEYACRAGTTTPYSCGFYISDTLANYNATWPSTHSTPGNYIGHPVPVGSYPPNPWGLYDMHGNVWEWVADWYAPYSSAEAIDPQGPSNGTMKIIRGGSWYFGADHAESSSRRTHEPGLWGFSIGFRIVRE